MSNWWGETIEPTAKQLNMRYRNSKGQPISATIDGVEYTDVEPLDKSFGSTDNQYIGMNASTGVLTRFGAKEENYYRKSWR